MRTRAICGGSVLGATVWLPARSLRDAVLHNADSTPSTPVGAALDTIAKEISVTRKISVFDALRERHPNFAVS